MKQDDEQDLKNVLKYNQDRLNDTIKNAESAIDGLEKSLKTSQHHPYDFTGVDATIAQSLEVLKHFGANTPQFEKGDYEPKDDLTVTLDDVVVQDWEQLVNEANEAGYHGVTIEDILTPEEIKHADARYQEIEDQFAEKTKLQKKDILFLVTAIALQCIRQYVLTPFDERVTADEAAKKVPQGTGEKIEDGTKRYYAPLNEIVSHKRVPYDTIAGSKKYNLGGDGKGLSGNTHRFRTLGHDPILGYVFGTSNILTNTLTDWKGKSYHIKYMPNGRGVRVPTIVQNADTAKMFSKVKARFETDKPSVAAAIAKQYWHLKSDVSTNGLPIPFVSSVSPDLAQKLAKYGVDSIALKEVAEQAGGSLLINFVISTIHGLIYDEKKDGPREIYKVRTRKVLLYSNLIASASNIIIVGIGAAAGVASDNPELIKKSLKFLDVGGLLVTIGRLFTDIRFITRVKEEFINNELNQDIQAEIDEIDQILAG